MYEDKVHTVADWHVLHIYKHVTHTVSQEVDHNVQDPTNN